MCIRDRLTLVPFELDGRVLAGPTDVGTDGTTGTPTLGTDGKLEHVVFLARILVDPEVSDLVLLGRLVDLDRASVHGTAHEPGLYDTAGRVRGHRPNLEPVS